MTSIGFALIPGGNFLESATLGFGAGLATTGDVEAAAISGLTAGMLGQIGVPKTFSKEAVGKAMQRGLVGGVSAEFQGGKFREGFLSVGSASLLSPGIDEYFESPPGRIAATGVISGTAAELGGGKFANGAATAAYLQSTIEAAKYFQREIGGRATLRPGENRDDNPFYEVNENGRQYIRDRNINVVGRNKPGLCAQGSTCSKILNLAPGANTAARIHDYWLNEVNGLPFNPMTNFGTIAPALTVGYAAIIGQPLQSLRTQQLIGVSISNSLDRDDDRRATYDAMAVGSR